MDNRIFLKLTYQLSTKKGNYLLCSVGGAVKEVVSGLCVHSYFSI